MNCQGSTEPALFRPHFDFFSQGCITGDKVASVPRKGARCVVMSKNAWMGHFVSLRMSLRCPQCT